MRHRLLSVVKLAVSVGLLAVLLAQVGARRTLEGLLAAHWAPLLAALALYVASLPLRALRWQALLEAQGIQVPLRRLVVLYYVGSFFNLLLPTNVGGDAVRAYELSRASRTPAEAVGTVLADRAIGLLVLFLLAALALPFSAHLVEAWVVWAVLGLLAAGLGGVALLVWPGPLRLVYCALPARLRCLAGRPAHRQLYRSLRSYDRRSLAVATAVSVAFNLVLVLINVLIGVALGVQVSLWHYLVSVSLISFLSALPISVSGLGVREWAYIKLFGQVGVLGPTATAMSLAYYLITLLSGLVGGALYAWEGARGVWRPADGA